MVVAGVGALMLRPELLAGCQSTELGPSLGVGRVVVAVEVGVGRVEVGVVRSVAAVRLEVGAPPAP